MFNSPLTFKEAAEAVGSRVDAATAKRYKDIVADWAPEARRRAFFSARVADATILSELHRRVSQVVNGEMTKKQAVRLLRDSFLGEKADALRAMGFAPSKTQRSIADLSSIPRLALVLETNVTMAQQRGQYQQWERVADAFPYGVWHCGYSEKHRPEHLARDGRCYPFDHPVWRLSPPGGEFNCHCWRELLTQAGAQRRGLVPEPLDSPFEPSSLGFDPSLPLDGSVQPGKRVLPELADKARQEPPPEAIRNILPENPPEPQPVAMLQETDEQHAARRQAQWQAAYEKRRDDWKAQCEKSIPVPQGHQDYAEYKRVVNTAVTQYTPNAARLGKPPKLDFGAGKSYMSADGKKLHIGGVGGNPQDKAWHQSDNVIIHEMEHWLHGKALQHSPTLKQDIEKAALADRKRIFASYRRAGQINKLKGWDSVDLFSNYLFNQSYSQLTLEQRQTVINVTDSLGSITGSHTYGMGHNDYSGAQGRQMKLYYGTRDYYKIQNQGGLAYGEAIANVKALRAVLPEQTINAIFPEINKIVFQMETLGQ